MSFGIAWILVLLWSQCPSGNDGADKPAFDDTGADARDTDTVPEDTDTGVEDSDTGPGTEDPPLALEDLEPGDLVVTEIVPVSCSAGGVWFELHNTRDAAVDLNGLTVAALTEWTVDVPLVVPGQGYLVFADSDDPAMLGGLEPDHADERLAFLGTEREALVQVGADGEIIDAAAWLVRACDRDNDGRAFTLDPTSLDATSNDDPDSWCRSLEPIGSPHGACVRYGTPGEANEACTNSVADIDGDGHELSPCGEDCDDSEPTSHPGAVEVCSDGLDNDCDGAIDCIDADCDQVPPCEDCDNGVDDDKDGLVDCEDGDCAGDGHCVELVCDDWRDNDEDGLTDCDDEDCWSADCFPRVSVSGGRYQRSWGSRRRLREFWSSWSSRCANGGSVRQTSVFEASALTGTVQVVPHGATTFTARITCDWSVAQLRVSFSGRRWWDSHTMDDGSSCTWELARDGAWVSSACGLDPDTFLPATLAIRSDIAWAGHQYCGYYPAYAYDARYVLLSTTKDSHAATFGPYANHCGSSTTWTSTTWQAGNIGSSATAGMTGP